MVSGKVVAAMCTATKLLAGCSAGQVIARYRERMADNTRRLAGEA